MKKLSIVVSLVFIALFSSGQKRWTLEDCLNHAQQNNLDIKQAVLNVESSKKYLFQSKANLLPNLNSSVSESRSFGRRLDMVTNEILEDNTRSNNFGLSSSVSLFNGFQNINTIRKNNFEYLASRYDADQIANNVSVNIVTAYLQLLYSKEMVNVNKEKLALSQIQLDRISAMVEVGELPRGSLLETEAQFAQEELSLINSQNQLAISLLNIKQMLDLSGEDDFDIIDPKIDPELTANFPPSTSIYEQALIVLPEVKSAMFRLKSAERGLAISQGGRSPRISLSASWGTAYSDARKLFTGFDESNNPIYADYPFEDQVIDNINKLLSLSVSLPIFNAWQVNNSIQQAKIVVKQSQYNLQKVKNELRKTIEQAQSDAVAANKQFVASQKTVDALEEAFRYTETKYKVQLVNSYQFYDAKNKLFSAQNNLLQAKYDFIFKLKMLDFYMGKKLTF